MSKNQLARALKDLTWQEMDDFCVYLSNMLGVLEENAEQFPHPRTLAQHFTDWSHDQLSPKAPAEVTDSFERID